MHIRNRGTAVISILSLIVIILYFTAYLLDFIDPKYLGIKSLNSLIFFKITSSPIPQAPLYNHGWHSYFGTTYYGIAILPALLASLKFDFTAMLFSLFLALFTGSLIGFSAIYIGGIYKKIISYLFNIYFEFPYIGIVLFILYIIRPSFYSIIFAVFLAWFPFYIGRMYRIYSDIVEHTGNTIAKFRYMLLSLVPYIAIDLGAITGLITIITYFGFYYKNSFVVDIGNIMYLSGNVRTFLLFGDWWIIILPLSFLGVFVASTAILAYELRNIIEDE
ncbi:MAG: hypothetical protein QXZ44_05870 [Ferroplasma sp.]